MALIRREPQFPSRDPIARFIDWGPFSRWIEPWRGLEEFENPVDEFVENDTLVIRAELPGVDPEKDVDVTVTENALHLHAERRQEQKVDERGYRRTEIRYGSFSRSVPLPPGVKDEDVQATYRDGVLEVRVTIDSDRDGGRKISISHG